MVLDPGLGQTGYGAGFSLTPWLGLSRHPSLYPRQDLPAGKQHDGPGHPGPGGGAARHEVGHGGAIQRDRNMR
jgi:hypothetical protein